MPNITDVFSSNSERTLAPAAVGTQVLLMTIVSVRPSVSAYITSALYLCRLGYYYHFIHHFTPNQQGEKFYHSVCAFPPTFVLDRL